MRVDGDLEQQGDLELARRALAGSWGQIALLTVFTTFTAYRFREPAAMAAFASVIVSGNLLRLYLGWRHSLFLPVRRTRWRRLMAAAILLPALSWGLLFFRVIREFGLTDYSTSIALLIGSGISAAIITSVAPDRRLGAGFVTLVIGIPLIALLQDLNERSTGIGLIFVFYYAFLSFQLRLYHQTFWRNAINQQSILQQRNRLQDMVDAIPGLVLWIGSDLRYKGVNRRFAQRYGAGTEEYLGKELGFRNVDKELVLAIRKFTASTADESALEIRITDRREPRCHLVVMRRVNPSKVQGSDEIYVVCIDVDDLKKAEHELEQERLRSELTSKLAALGELNANVAHEIRNPLTAVIAATEMSQKLLEATQPDLGTLRKLAAKILETCARINKLIDALKGFSRKSSGDPYVVTSLRDVVRSAVDLVEHHFGMHHVALKVDPIDEPVSIDCRPVEITQVLVNLLTNGLDAARGRDEKWVRLRAVATGEDVRILITDSGMGIPEPVSEQMFNPFFTTKPAGTGPVSA
ncbi:MAG: ATP-binding protein [Oligoflexia bacterium]|nr:ATP-binding protein [Oligoflexia bacterium]